ncbi:Sec20-domain-containing protein [Phycomyces nitens]|nr:Sec20-domain-containing protein [Phycomyces nitens]
MSTEKLRGIAQLSAECQRLVRRLGQVDSIALQKEVATLLKNDLRTFENDIQHIKQLAEQEDSLASKASILEKLAEYETQFKQLQVNSRQAIWQSKQRVEQQDRKQREELFGMRGRMDEKSFTEQFELKQRHTQGDQRLLQASSEVTEALGKTRQLMEQELEKSSYSAIMLADSSKTLSATRSEYANLGSLMTISKRLISQLESADWFDRVSLLLGVLLFSGVVLYIIKKRTWDVGISWIGWLSGSSKTIKHTTTVLSSPTATSVVSSIASTSAMRVEL